MYPPMHRGRHLELVQYPHTHLQHNMPVSSAEPPLHMQFACMQIREVY
jgi:hypothetical protein